MPDNFDDLTILRIADVLKAIGLRRTQFNQLRRDGDFPEHIELSQDGRAIGWYRKDVFAWLKSRALIGVRHRESPSPRVKAKREREAAE